MALREKIMAALQEIPDPEMPISIVDLGIIEDVTIEPAGDDNANVSVTVLPTFVGCPALAIIEQDIAKSIRALPGVATVDVEFVFDPPWSVTRITDNGREALKAHGVTVPASGTFATEQPPQVTTQLRTSAVPCPYCNSTATYLDSPFGPTRCRMIYYCESCRNSFEHMKRV